MKRPLTAILAGVALLLGGCNLSGESSTGQGTVNLSVGISKPTAGAHTNQRDVEVRIAATGGERQAGVCRPLLRRDSFDSEWGCVAGDASRIPKLGDLHLEG